MASGLQRPIELSVAFADERWALLQRVAASPAFQKSNRLREVLLYVGERSLRTPETPIREHEIGVEVFGRPETYDTSQDTLVRVHASQLRKKLQQHFTEDGLGESLLIEMPKGSYSLAFRPRVAGAEPQLVVLPSPPRRSRWWTALIAVSVMMTLACGLLLVQNSTLRRRATFELGAQPAIDAFWRQIFGNGRNNYIVAADANLVVFEDAIKGHVSLQDYQAKAFERLAWERIADPEKRALILNLLRPFTPMADTIIARRISLVSAANGMQTELVFARDLTVNQVSDHNAIVLGSRRANPWVGLFEDRLNFRTVFEEAPKRAWFQNRAPKAGEQATYHGRWGRMSYCRVAFLSNPKGTGNVLLISGTDVQSTEAGGEFVTREEWVRQLWPLLGVKVGQPLPYFEVLLQGELVSQSIPQFRISAWRRY
ncbi:MAG TPA: hypothetical protein VGK29_04995 [Paludibaculum sp.]|jgi:hypothetical protein